MMYIQRALTRNNHISIIWVHDFQGNLQGLHKFLKEEIRSLKRVRVKWTKMQKQSKNARSLTTAALSRLTAHFPRGESQLTLARRRRARPMAKRHSSLRLTRSWFKGADDWFSVACVAPTALALYVFFLHVCNIFVLLAGNGGNCVWFIVILNAWLEHQASLQLIFLIYCLDVSIKKTSVYRIYLSEFVSSCTHITGVHRIPRPHSLPRCYCVQE